MEVWIAFAGKHAFGEAEGAFIRAAAKAGANLTGSGMSLHSGERDLSFVVSTAKKGALTRSLRAVGARRRIEVRISSTDV